jgi:hypothetical protein
MRIALWARYEQQVLNRINFNRRRIYPALQVNASAGADIYTSGQRKVRLQVDGQNLSNVLKVIDFGRLFQAMPSALRAAVRRGRRAVSSGDRDSLFLERAAIREKLASLSDRWTRISAIQFPQRAAAPHPRRARRE